MPWEWGVPSCVHAGRVVCVVGGGSSSWWCRWCVPPFCSGSSVLALVAVAPGARSSPSCGMGSAPLFLMVRPLDKAWLVVVGASCVWWPVAE